MHRGGSAVANRRLGAAQQPISISQAGSRPKGAAARWNPGSRDSRQSRTDKKNDADRL